MKKTYIISALMIFFISFSSFLTPKEENIQLLPTKLRVTVVDYLGNFSEGATVEVYRSEEDYNNEENQIGETYTTDKKGRVTIKDLEPKVYFLNVKNGDLNNYGGGVQTGKLEEGKLNKINIVID